MGRRRLILLLTGCIVLAAAAFAALRLRGGSFVSAARDCAPAEEIVFYRQDDVRWAAEKLGESRFSMETSGCLVCCIASALAMSGEEDTPLTLNRTLSRCSAYDSEGNLLWGKLAEAGDYTVEVCGRVSEEFLLQCLQDGKYPIVRVRVHGLGNFHYVLVVEARGGKFYCMDPLREGLCSLADYGNRVYAVRCVSPEQGKE